MIPQVNIPVVKKFMEQNNLSEYQLSKQMNMDYSQIYRVLRKQKGPGQRFISELIRVTGMTFEKLFILDDKLPVGNESGTA